MKAICVAILLTGGLAFFVGGCSSPGDAQAMAGQDEKGAAQLWADNCARCHNSRSPSTYSDAEWDVAVHHMRVRANLTAEEHKKIAEFMKAGN